MITGDRPSSPADFDARIAAIEAAPDAPESWAATVERMARAMAESGDHAWDDWPEYMDDVFRRLADAALRVVTEPADGTDSAKEHEHGAWCHPSADGCPDDVR